MNQSGTYQPNVTTMGPVTTGGDAKAIYDMAKGEITIGHFHVTYDLTDGLSEEEFIRRYEWNRGNPVITKEGRMLMPRLGIY